MLITVFAVSMVFLSLDSYAVAQDKVMRTAYFSNYLQSLAKSVYYIDVSTLRNVESYCDDDELSGGAQSAYCKQKDNAGNDKYGMDCSDLGIYKGRISVADLVKKDLDYSDEDNGRLDDAFGDSKQMGRMALRCSMKEVMKPLTFSGYSYLTEVAKAGPTDVVVHANENKYASNYMFHENFLALEEMQKSTFDCAMVSNNATIGGAQLLVVRTPFTLILVKDGTFETANYVLRTCVWPTS